MNTIQQLLNQYGLILTDYELNSEMVALMPSVLREHITMANVTINNEELVLVDTDDELSDDRFIQLIKLLKNVPLPMLFITDHLSADTQLLLTQNKFGFISESGIYLPSLTKPKTVVPTMQLISLSKNQHIIIIALLYWKLLHDDTSNTFHIKVRQLAELLGITPMTISRTLTTFVDAGWLTTSGYTRNHSFAIPEGYDLNTWMQAILRLLPSPVQRTLYVPIEAVNAVENKRMAGVTALSKFTVVPPTKLVSWAMPNKAITTELTSQKVDQFMATLQPKKYVAVEAWKFDPQIFKRLLPANYQITVDPVSLYLTLHNTNDRQVGEQLNNLLNQLVKSRQL